MHREARLACRKHLSDNPDRTTKAQLLRFCGTKACAAAHVTRMKVEILLLASSMNHVARLHQMPEPDHKYLGGLKVH